MKSQRLFALVGTGEGGTCIDSCPTSFCISCFVVILFTKCSTTLFTPVNRVVPLCSYLPHYVPPCPSVSHIGPLCPLLSRKLLQHWWLNNVVITLLSWLNNIVDNTEQHCSRLSIWLCPSTSLHLPPCPTSSLLVPLWPLLSRVFMRITGLAHILFKLRTKQSKNEFFPCFSQFS